jgi:glycosyltransferase involved in cell wall biosynthesis
LQLQEPHELVIINDGSTDEATLRALAELEREGICVLHQENRGLSSARMTGVHATTAPYVLPLDADDLLLPGALAALADALDADPRAAVSWGDLQLFEAFELHVPTADSLDPWLITYLSEIPGTSMVRRTALAQAGGWSLGHGYEDWDLWLALAERGWGGVRVGCDVLRVRQHVGRLNAGWLEQHGDFVDELRRRHPGLYRRRGSTRRASRAPLRSKLLFPALERLPLPARDRFRLMRLLHHPVRMLDARRRRGAAR